MYKAGVPTTVPAAVAPQRLTAANRTRLEVTSAVMPVPYRDVAVVAAPTTQRPNEIRLAPIRDPLPLNPGHIYKQNGPATI
jgi:hypothetical protein